MKSILPWLVAVIALGAAGFVWSGDKSKTEELAKLQQQVQETESLRAEIAELKKTVTPPDEIERLRKDNQELIRLRGEVGMIRKEKEQVAKQLSSAQTEVQRAAEATAVESRKVQEKDQALLQARTQIVAGNVVQIRDACINNLRQIDGAKQQWALENNKTAGAIPKKEDITPYLQEQKLPKCPGAGTYTLNAVDALPACSVATHTLAQ